ncbi:MAG: hypothetical protein H7288_13500 [Kineosporiaceae bacterium]|nr:hypothetical protein [Aeromicrobium sp.]
MNTKQAIEATQQVWKENMSELTALKRDIRKAALDDMESELAEITRVRREAAARAIYYAIDHGATKTALRKVTTSDHWNFESFVDLGIELAEAEAQRGHASE